MSQNELLNKKVLVLCNLPEKKMRGVSSHGMVLASSVVDESEKLKIALIEPPVSSQPGDNIKFDTGENPVSKLSSKKLEKILKNCKVDEDGVAVYIDENGRKHKFETSGGVCTSPLKNANIS